MGDIRILFEDNHLLVVEKPPNIPSQADESGDPDMLSLLKADLKERYDKPGNVYLGLVHRLDRPVGGVMVFAKTSKAASRLSDAVRTRSFDKTYMAVVHGTPPERQARLVHYLWKDEARNVVTIVDRNRPGAKEADLEYATTATADGLSLVKVKLHTGRPHQIRVQFAGIGCPLYGDQKYGQHRNKPGQQIALWSVRIAFEHPTLKQQLEYNSVPPNVYPWTIWNE